MIEQFEQVGRAVGDLSRVRLLKLLERGELCVCQLTAVLGLAPATVSKHLSVLKAAGLLQQRREGKWIHYRLAEKDFNPYARPFLALVAAQLNEEPTVIEDRRRLEQINAIPLPSLCEPERAGLPPEAPAAAAITMAGEDR